ncbi:hypothetical protein D3C74_49080 [compost metagenome]
MGSLKKMIGQAMVETDILDDRMSGASVMFDNYRKKFNSMVGQTIIWTSPNNPDLKHPQLVVVSAAFEYFVLVSKVTYNVEAQVSTLKHAINYASLYSGQDKIETLEMEPI